MADTHVRLWLLAAILTLSASQEGAASDWSPGSAGDPFGVFPDTLPRLYSPRGIEFRFTPGISSGRLAWRPRLRGAGMARTSAGSLPGLVERTIAMSTRAVLRDSFASSCILRSTDDGTLLPTIYLPLDMPPILARTIGEGGQLDISGHQKITLTGITHYRPNAVQYEGESASLFPDLLMEQELKVQLNGTIGEKIHVDVDHDSERELQPENRIRLAYEGWEDEIIQSIEIGDVSLSITGPEFVSYSIPHEGLFGAKMVSQVGPVDITTIASSEASSTESAEFVGQAQMVADSILDIDPADNYFFLVYPDSQEQSPIVSLVVFRDDQDGTNDDETGAVPGSWSVPLPGGGTLEGTGMWDELIAGPEQDYVLVDSGTAIRFISPVNTHHLIAVYAVTAGGDTLGSLSPLELRLIKEDDPLPSDPTWPYELRNRYFLGSNNIVQESFLCTIYLSEPGQTPVSVQDGVPFIELLGLDTNGDGSLSDEQDAVDWENGFLVFPDYRPFVSDSLDVKNPSVYEEKDPETSDSRYFIAVDYRAASTTFSLGRIGIVPGSERVTLTVAGVEEELVRDQDYTIVYEIGLLTLMGERAEQAQDPNNVLRVTFEYLPFLSVQQKLLFGTRAVYGLGENTWVGATAMFENTSTSEDRPRVGEESSRTLVTDVDARWETRPAFLTDAVNLLPGVNTDAPSRFMLSGEVAASFPDPNTAGRAWIDDMEGTESSFPVGQSRPSWSRSSMPVGASPLIAPPGMLRWYNPQNVWRVRDIVPQATGRDADGYANTVLEMVFTPRGGSLDSWGGLVRLVDKYGIDFSEKTRIRLYVRATGSASSGELYLDLGEWIDEDSYWLEPTASGLEMRANGLLDTEDANGNGVFESGEDTGLDNLWSSDEPGWSGSNPDPHMDDWQRLLDTYKINGTEGNTRLDTEDLNGNGQLDRYDSFFRIRIPLDDPDYILYGPNADGWMLVEIPLSDSALVTVPSSSEQDPTWERISYARLWVTGFSQSDTLCFYDFSIVGNRWEQRAVQNSDSVGTPVLPGEMLNVSTINNRDNPGYTVPPGVDPGEDENGDTRLEQSLVLSAVGIQPGHQGIATQHFYASEDYTGYQGVRFPVHGGPEDAGEFFFRMGRDTLNYYEICTQLQPGWQEVEVDFSDLTQLGALLEERDLDYLRVGDLAARGSPNLGDVLVMSAGIRNDTPQPLTTDAWLDDIVLLDPYSGVDFAHRLSTGVEFADLLRVNGDYRRMGADFHGLGSTSGQGATTTRYGGDATMNLEKFSPRTWFLSMPATFAWNRQISEPSFSYASDRRLDPGEAWQERTQTEDWDTSVILRRNRTSSTGIARYVLDPWQVSHTYGRTTGRSPVYRDSLNSGRAELKYNLTMPDLRIERIPLVQYLQLTPSRISWTVARQDGWDTRWELGDEDTVQTRATSTRDLDTDGSVTFNLWNGQSATYSLGVGRDLLYPWSQGLPFNAGRETSRSQGVSVSQELGLWSYLYPRVSYDAAYSSSRLAPHTAGGQDSLGMPDFGVSATRRLNLRIGLVSAIRDLTRLRDERLDEEAEPGSPRWLLSRMDRYADRLTDPTIVISRTVGTEYRDMLHYPGTPYMFGVDPILDGLDPYDRTTSDNLQVSTGLRPLTSLSLRTEYSSTDTRHYYSGYWNRQQTKTWPSVSATWTGLERLGPLSRLLRSGSLSTGFRLETTESGRYEDGEYIPTSRTRAERWSPLASVNANFSNDVQVTLSDNFTTTETRNFTGTQARTRSNSHSTQFNLQYAFSAPGGFRIPIPLLNLISFRFASDLTTGLRITRSRLVTRIIVPGYQDEVQSDREEWRIEPSANYDFGTVTAGLTAIYGWKKDRVNSVYDQRDVGMDIWVLINF